MIVSSFAFSAVRSANNHNGCKYLQWSSLDLVFFLSMFDLISPIWTPLPSKVFNEQKNAEKDFRGKSINKVNSKYLFTVH